MCEVVRVVVRRCSLIFDQGYCKSIFVDLLVDLLVVALLAPILASAVSPFF
jgi:hypothetical protein